MRRLLLIILPVALLLGTLVVIFLVRRASPPTTGEIVPPTSETVERARTALEAALQGCAGDEKCIEETTARYAALSQVAELCGKIEDPETHDSCLLAIGLRLEDQTVCDQASDEKSKEKCRDTIILKKARETKEIQTCEQLSGGGALAICLTDIIAGSEDRSKCDSLSERAREICLATVITNQASFRADASLCQEISDEYYRSVCSNDEGGGLTPIEEFVPLDSDGDGLSDLEERQRGTNPRFADTDGDGFDDGTEVKNGFNPLGEGRL